MRYAILMFTVPEHSRAMTESDLEVVRRKHEKLRRELTESGELAGGAGMVPADETASLRLGPEGVVTQEGPLPVVGDEHLSAYYEIECESEDRAREIAAITLDDHVTAVEVRRIHDTAQPRTEEA
jgi:hypothetical protein